MAGPDLSTVSFMASYRVGYIPPAMGTLAPGELFVETTPPGGGAPRLWIGTAPGSGFPGDTALILPAPSGEIADIVIDAIDNPSTASTVTITGTVTPGGEIELVVLQGENSASLVQIGGWSPWDATDGTFAMSWFVPEGDNYRVRARLRADPSQSTDSNLFAVTAAAASTMSAAVASDPPVGDPPEPEPEPVDNPVDKPASEPHGHNRRNHHRTRLED
jgi:hypothetical protein